MVKHFYRLTAGCAALGLILCGVWLLLPFSVSADTQTNAAAEQILNIQSDGDVQEWIDHTLIAAPSKGTNDWYALGLAASGQYDLQGYAEALADTAAEHFPSGTSGERIALTMLACTENAPEICTDILRECIGKQGIMSWIFGLHLLNNGVSADISVETVVNELLTRQCADGGWAVMGDYGDVDVTAMALQALAPYQHTAAAEKPVNKALTFLSEHQLDSGAFSSFGTENPESTAQVWIALRSLGIAPTDTRFVKSGTLYDGIMQFSLSNGRFSHTLNGEANETATVQVFLALTAESLSHPLYLFHGASPETDIPAITSTAAATQQQSTTESTTVSETSVLSDTERTVRTETSADTAAAQTTSAAQSAQTETTAAKTLQTVSDSSLSSETTYTETTQTTNQTAQSAMTTIMDSAQQTAATITAAANLQTPNPPAPPYRMPVTIGAGIVFVVVSAVLWIRKKRSVKSYATLAFFTGTAVVLAWTLKIESPEQYYRQQEKSNAVGSVSMSIRCDVILGLPGSEKYPSDGTILPETVFPIDADDSALNVLYDAVKAYGLQIEVDGVSGDMVDNAYVRGIASLYEFDFGELSGWTYTVNGERPAVGAGSCPLHDGDVVVWAYTVNL